MKSEVIDYSIVGACTMDVEELLDAVRNDDLERIRLLVEQGDLIDAVRYNHLERARLLLLEQGADKDMFDSIGDTLLHLAASGGCLDIVRLLVEHGATIDIPSTERIGSYTPLSCAVFHGQLDICRYLLEQGADRDKPDRYGATPLHDAARGDDLEIVMLLMSYGADLNARNGDGYCLRQGDRASHPR